MAARELAERIPLVDLETLRAEIDRIDDALLGLIGRRLAVAAAMAPLKERDGDLALRPGREAAILRRLAAQSPAIPQSLIRALWRELMSHGLQAQAPIDLILHGEDVDLLLALSRERFGSAAPASIASSAADALETALAADAIAVIGAASVPENLDPRLRTIETFKRRSGAPVAYAVGRICQGC